jgi:hypothetical protein
MATCVGQIRGGKNCKNKAQSGRKYCKVHDKDYKDAQKSRTEERKAKSFKTLDYIAARVGDNRLKQGLEEDNLVKTIKCHKESLVQGFVQKAIIPCIKELATLEYDLYGYPKRSTPFCRKIWMMISWHLSDDNRTYVNMAMTCKGLYKVFVTDKVKWYIHPLKAEIMSPLLFFRPVYRVLSLQVPTDLDDLLEVLALPTVEDFLAVYSEEYGYTKNEVILNRRKADAIIELIKNLVERTLEEGQEIDEAFEGAGLFGDYDTKAVFRFYDLPYRYKMFVRGSATYVMIDADPGPALERKLLDSLCPFDGQFLIKLMNIH